MTKISPRSTRSLCPLRPNKGRGLRLLFLLISTLFSLTLNAQTDETARRRDFDDVFSGHATDSVATDTLSLAGRAANNLDLPWNTPALTVGGYGLAPASPYYGGFGDYGWRLHEGFNAQFGMSITAGLGKHAPRGVGFGQTAAFAYVAPLTKKLSIAAGVFATNFDWGSYRRTNVGIGGVLAYEVNERINLYVFGEKSFLPRTTARRGGLFGPFPLMLDTPSSRIGAAAEFKIGKNAMIGISVEHRTYGE